MCKFSLEYTGRNLTGVIKLNLSFLVLFIFIYTIHTFPGTNYLFVKLHNEKQCDLSSLHLLCPLSSVARTAQKQKKLGYHFKSLLSLFHTNRTYLVLKHAIRPFQPKYRLLTNFCLR